MTTHSATIETRPLAPENRTRRYSHQARIICSCGYESYWTTISVAHRFQTKHLKEAR